MSSLITVPVDSVRRKSRQTDRYIFRTIITRCTVTNPFIRLNHDSFSGMYIHFRTTCKTPILRPFAGSAYYLPSQWEKVIYNLHRNRYIITFMNSGFVQHVLSSMPPALRIKLYTLGVAGNATAAFLIAIQGYNVTTI